MEKAVGTKPPWQFQLREHHLCPLSPTGDTANDKPSSRGLVCPADRAQCVCKSTAAAKTRFFSVNFWQNREEETFPFATGHEGTAADRAEP